APLTADSWDESKPIRFVYYSSGVVLSNVTSVFRREPQTVFDGEMTDMTLPVYIRSEYEKAGLKLAENVTVVHSEYFMDGKIRDNFRDSYSHISLYGGIALSALIAFILLLWRVQPIKQD
ncbi:MAG: hypothetical protein M3T96_06955, partial [Acidobacteriota bacterium]|nr:hypothetical protein [Acidobacteriota bacterium]